MRVNWVSYAPFYGTSTNRWYLSIGTRRQDLRSNLQHLLISNCRLGFHVEIDIVYSPVVVGEQEGETPTMRQDRSEEQSEEPAYRIINDN
jgi:hypothetical protein